MATAEPTEEEFLAWKDHPVTQFVIGAYERMAEAQKEQWIRQSWDSDHADSYDLCSLKTRADAYRSMAESDLSDFIAAHEPEAQ